MSKMKGKRIIVTGGASGIGLAIVRRFAAEGGNVTLVDNKESGLDAVSKLKSEAMTVNFVQCNVAKDTLHFVMAPATTRFILSKKRRLFRLCLMPPLV